MEDKTIEPRKQWRESLARQQVIGERLEAIAEQYPEIPFEVRPHWIPPTLDWSEFRGSLETFCSRVRRVAKLFGPPDKTKAEHWFSPDEAGRVPDLVARWERPSEVPAETFVVMVRTFAPEGCKLDPRYDFVKGANERIHPECQAVVGDLMDLPEPSNA